MKRIAIFFLTAALAMTGNLAAQTTLGDLPKARNIPNTKPVAGIEEPARKVADLGFTRPHVQDSTLSGGSGFAFGPPTTVSFPDTCDFDDTKPGCANFCVANPTAAGCGSGDSGVIDPPPPTDGGPSIGWCGMPEDYSLNQDPECYPVSGGWQCYRSGDGWRSYYCP